MTDRYQVSVILTDECNMRCRYCTTAKRPVAIDDRILDRIAVLLDRTAPATLDVNFHGGEPTLVWDAVEGLEARLARLARDRRISRNICTNGTKLTPERAQFLADRAFNVRVSIDGRRESHTKYRFLLGGGHSESGAAYDATVEGLQMLRDAGARVAVNMVVTPATVSELARNAVFLINLGLVHLVVSPVVGMPWDDEHLLTLDHELAKMRPVWSRWLEMRPARLHEDLRRAILSEIDRATYCIGERMNQPDAKVFVIGPSGRIFGDEPEARTEETLVLGHVDTIERFEDLPPLGRTAFQLMYDRAFYAPTVLRDVRRTHRLLRKHMRSLYEHLFGPLPPEARPDAAASESLVERNNDG